MSRKMILWAAPAMLMLGAAAATPDITVLDQAFGNTVVSTYPDGRTAEMWLQRDGSYTAVGRAGARSSGHWKLKGDKICLKQQHPWVPISYCTPLPSETSWSAKAVSGEPVRLRVVQGVSTSPGPS